VKQRHSAKHLFWRGVVASVGSAAMTTGVYPVLPHVGVHLARRKRNLPVPPSHVRTMAREWAVSVAMSATRPVGFLGLPVSLRQRTGPRPIILLHGYAMSRANFLPMARRLARAGLGPVFGFEYWSLGRTSKAAKRLGRYVERVCEATASPRVDLVGHSMGGVVSRYYAVFGGGADRIRNLITLGTPHRGTDVSGFGIGRSSRELYPGSSTMDRLGSARLPPEIRCTAIWSRSDALVPGARNARLQGVEEIIYDDIGHMTLLTSRRVTAEIIARLRKP
jgi:pimeloyl-ACP methyl ester carboxylesterase